MGKNKRKQSRVRTNSLTTTKEKVQKRTRFKSKRTARKIKIDESKRILPGSGPSGSRNSRDVDLSTREPGEIGCNVKKWQINEAHYKSLAGLCDPNIIQDTKQTEWEENGLDEWLPNQPYENDGQTTEEDESSEESEVECDYYSDTNSESSHYSVGSD